MNKNSALTDIEVSRLPSGNSNCTDTKLRTLWNSFFPLVQTWLKVLCLPRVIFCVGQEMVKEKYHSSKSGKLQGILTLPRRKVERTSELIFPLVQACVASGSLLGETYVLVRSGNCQRTISFLKVMEKSRNSSCTATQR